MSENTIYAVEVLVKDQWVTVTTTMDEDRANTIKAEWLSAKQPADEIRITQSTIKFRGQQKDEL